MKVTISGLPGSGTSTAAELLRDTLNYELVSAGQIFRSIAKDRDMSLAEFSKYAEENFEVDRELDRRMLQFASTRDDLILEGRLTGVFATKKGIDAVKVWLKTDAQVRAQRIADREGQDVKKALKEMLAREKSEQTRYKEIYGIDLQNETMYDLVIDSGIHRPPQIVEQIGRALNAGQ
jgi:predicted cytidylate kinase